MDSKGNKLSSCQIPDQYLKKQKSYYTFGNFGLKKKKRKEYNVRTA